MHHAQRQPGDGAGGQGDAGGHDQVPHVALGVQVGDGHALVGPRVVAGEGRVNYSKLGYPGSAVHTGRVSTTLEKVFRKHLRYLKENSSHLYIDKKHSTVFGWRRIK